MKIKWAYMYAVYELGTFFVEMHRRKSNSIRFEFQEGIGKFTIYIDDSSFKTIDGKIGWEIIKNIYSFLSQKTKNGSKEFSFDKNKDFEFKIDDEDFSQLASNYQLKLFPLPKGKYLNYNYVKKTGGIYEASFVLKDNNLHSLICEEIDSIKSILNNKIDLFFDLSINTNSKIVELEDILLKKNKKDENKDEILLFLYNELENDNIFIKVPFSQFKTKKNITVFFSKFKTKKTVVNSSNWL